MIPFQNPKPGPSPSGAVSEAATRERSKEIRSGSSSGLPMPWSRIETVTDSSTMQPRISRRVHSMNHGHQERGSCNECNELEEITSASRARIKEGLNTGNFYACRGIAPLVRQLLERPACGASRSLESRLRSSGSGAWYECGRPICVRRWPVGAIPLRGGRSLQAWSLSTTSGARLEIPMHDPK